jgi:hypothetical protein
VRKHLRVFGDRVWDRSFAGGLRISGPEFFESMPITYERAYGGWDRRDPDPAKHRLESRNPVGTGFALSAEHSVGMKLPNIENPEDLIASWKQRPAPAGANAIDCAWSPRRELAGTYDAKWRELRSPLWAEDFKPQYHNCAPRDQQLDGFLHGGEAVELTNLTPDRRVAFHVPKVYPFFETRFGREKVEHRPQLCTITIEPDRSRITLAWQTSLVCNHRVDELDGTFVTEKRFL